MPANYAHKKLLFITTRLFWPADSGRKVVLWNYCKGIYEQLGYELYLYSFLESDQDPSMLDSKPGFVKEIKLASCISALSKVCGLARAALVERKEPFQCALFYDQRNAKSLRAYVEQVKPDVVIVDMVRLSPYFKAISDYPCIKIIDFDDLLSKRYERQANSTRADGNTLGKYSEAVSGVLNSIVQIDSIKRLMFRIEANRVREAEIKYAHLYDASILISAVEGSEFAACVGDESVFVATMGAKVFDYVPENKRNIQYDLAFVGNMGTAANQDSLKLIIEDILPLIPDVSLRVIGICPREITERYGKSSQVSFSGRIEDIRESLLECKILFAPLAYGTGIKTKILEAMGMGVPVVTNSVGIEGIGATSGKDCICADDPKTLSASTMRLLDNEKERETMGVSGLRYVRESHQWEDSISEIGRCIKFCEMKRRA